MFWFENILRRLRLVVLVVKRNECLSAARAKMGEWTAIFPLSSRAGESRDRDAVGGLFCNVFSFGSLPNFRETWTSPVSQGLGAPAGSLSRPLRSWLERGQERLRARRGQNHSRRRAHSAALASQMGSRESPTCNRLLTGGSMGGDLPKRRRDGWLVGRLLVGRAKRWKGEGKGERGDGGRMKLSTKSCSSSGPRLR
jgi:hypothetical protein